jgi:hypothetical protein
VNPRQSTAEVTALPPAACVSWSPASCSKQPQPQQEATGRPHGGLMGRHMEQFLDLNSDYLSHVFSLFFKIC